MKLKDKIKGFKISYRSFFMLVFLTLGIISLLFTIAQSYTRTSKYILANANKAYLERLSQTNKAFEDNLTQVASITAFLGTTRDLVDRVKQYDSALGGTKSTIQKEISSACSKAMIFNKYIDGIIVATEMETTYVSTRVFDKNRFSEIKTELLDMAQSYKINVDKEVLFFLPEYHEENIGDVEMMEYLKSRYFFYTPVEEGYVQYAGIFVILNPNIFDNITDSNDESLEKYVILGNENEVLFKSKYVNAKEEAAIKNALNQPSTENLNSAATTNYDNLRIYSMENSLLDWKMALFHSETLIRDRLSVLKLIFLAVSLFILILIVGFYAVLSKKITMPITRLVNFVKGYNIDEGSEYDSKKEKTGFQLKILYTMIVIILIPNLILTVFTQVYASRIVKEYIIESNENLFEYTAKRVDKLILDKKTIASAMSFNQNIQQLFINEDDYIYEEDLESVIDGYLLLGNGRDEILILDKYDRPVYSDYIFYDKPQYSFEDIHKSKDFSIWGETRINRFKTPEIEMYVKINNLTSLKTLGYIVCKIPEEDISEIYEEITDSKINIFIINQDGKIISHTDKNLIGRDSPYSSFEGKNGVIYDEESFAFSIPLENTDWKMIGIFDDDVFYKDISQSLVEKIYLFGIMVAVVLLLSYIIASKTTTHLRRMYSLLDSCETESLEAVFPEESRIVEISELGSAFNDMITRTEILLDKLLIYNKKQNELENRKREAEFIALQTQINPHFLYNTFECINWMIKCGEKDSAVKMVTALSNMLHFVAKTENMIVSIEKELDYTKTYIEIMAIKFRSNIEFKLEIADEILKYKTIKLLLQPIVENSVCHGIGYAEGTKGTISIKCVEDGESLIFVISDDGKGMTEEAIEKLNHDLESGIHYNRVGLYNVQNRIKLFFGDNYGIKVMPNNNKGTIVEARIPKLENIKDFEPEKKRPL